jgi:hypothetical protein
MTNWKNRGTNETTEKGRKGKGIMEHWNNG